MKQWEKLKIALNLLKVRLYAAGRILFRPKEGFIVLRISEAELEKMIRVDLCDEVPDFSEVDIPFSYHRLQLYNAYKVISILGDRIDRDQMVIMKAEYEIGAEEWMKKNMPDGKKRA